MAMEVFCSFYQCARIFHVDIFNTTSSWFMMMIHVALDLPLCTLFLFPCCY
jgi:hypothetical protein